MTHKETTDGDPSDDAVPPVVIVGWDGAPFHLISDLVADGDLPTLERIADAGWFGPLETVPYVMSSCAWSTFLTGKNAGKHGVFDFYSNEFEEGTYFRTPIDGAVRDASDIGEVLNDSGRTIGQLNVPMTFPAREIDEFLVAGMLTPDVDSDGFTHPPEFLEEYEHLDEYKIDVGEGKDADRETFLDAVDRTVENRMRLIRYAVDRSDHPDVLFAVFTVPDRLSHYFYHFVDESHPFRVNESDRDLEQFADVLPDLYRDLDEKLDSILDLVEREYGEKPAVAVVSDHGMTSLKRVFHVNKWLSRHGYLTFKDGEESLDEEIEEKLDDRVEYIFGKVDWSETTAYAMGKRGAIYVNLEGREPEGVVPEEEYDEVVESLVADLQEVVDPEIGEDVIEAVNTREDLFHGDNVDKAPDVLLELDEGYYPFGYAFELESPDLFSTNDWPDMPFVTGIEDKPGILGIAGPGIADDAGDVDVSLIDIAPTLYHYLGVAVPSDLDGRVVEELFEAGYREGIDYGPPVDDHDPGDGDDDEEAVKERLKDLGYL